MNDANDVPPMADESPPTWGRVNLSDILSGDFEPLEPTLLERTDGVCLWYPGLTHSLSGEPESGKSLIMQAECARLVNEGVGVLYLDFEADEKSVVERLLMLGAKPEAVKEHFDYRHPEVRPYADQELRAWEELLSRRYELAVIDGVTNAMGICGYSVSDNDESAAWARALPDPIAARTGAAVVSVDHVVKNRMAQGRFAIGAQHKLAGLSGAAYTVEAVTALGRDMVGELVLRICKDRPGAVRPHCGKFDRDRAQEAARIVVDSTGDITTLTISPPRGVRDEGTSEPPAFRPTRLMQRAWEVIEQHPGELTENGVFKKTGGKKTATILGIKTLKNEEYVKTEKGRSGYLVYWPLRPYREEDDPLSDTYDGNRNNSPQNGSPTCSRFLVPVKGGNKGTPHGDSSREQLGTPWEHGNTSPENSHNAGPQPPPSPAQSRSSDPPRDEDAPRQSTVPVGDFDALRHEFGVTVADPPANNGSGQPPE